MRWIKSLISWFTASPLEAGGLEMYKAPAMPAGQGDSDSPQPVYRSVSAPSKGSMLIS